jgi:restriction system protein
MARYKHPQLPERQEYYPATVTAMKARGGSATIEELEQDVADILDLSDEARSLPHGDGRQTQCEYDLAWVRTYLKFAGAVENSERGVWRLTPVGRQLSDTELRGLWKRIVAEQRNRRKEKDSGDAGKAGLASDDDPEVPPEASWKEQLLGVLHHLEPSAFERLCQRLLRESGFIKVEVTGRTGDGGIDGVGVLRVNLLSFHVLFQCKRYKGAVGSSVIRDFRGAMVGRADKGLVMTTGHFTADARREATRDGAPAIDLIDGEALCDLLKQTRIGVGITLVEHVSVDESAFRTL